MCEMKTFIEKAIDQCGSRKLRSGDETIYRGIEHVVAAIADELHGSESSAFSHLVHYTGMDVVFAMLNDSDDKRGLRLYDTVHANDPEEGRFLLLHWPESDDEDLWMWKQDGNDSSGESRGRSFKQQVRRGHYPGHAYVLSFVPSACEERNNDRIVFWREYGRQGAGCSLSIPRDRLSDDEECSLALYRVRYGQADVEALAEQLRRRLFDPIEEGIRGIDGPASELFKAAQPKVRKELQLFRYLYKDSAYEHEKEYRLVILDASGVIEGEPTYEERTDARRETVFRHYRTHASLSRKRILGLRSQVILGPTVPHRENAKRTIDELLRRRNISGTEVTSSEIRYRRR